MWTPAGLIYYEKIKEDKEAPEPKLGEHYVVIDCEDPENYIAFLENSATQLLRHRLVLVRWKRPHVPQPSATPLSTSHLSEEERCRIFSVYLRPWVLNKEFAPAHVPLLTDLDFAVSDVLSAQQSHRDLQESKKARVRLRWKKHAPVYSTWNSSCRYPSDDGHGNLLQRGYVKAWKDYRCGHVVSQYAARIIQQFSASHLADSLETAENDPGETFKKERAPVDTSWYSLSAVHKILQRTTSLERVKFGNEDHVRISKHAHQVEAVKSISEKLWSISDTQEATQWSLDKHGNITSQSSEQSLPKDNEKSPVKFVSSKMDANLLYQRFRKKIATELIFLITPPKRNPTFIQARKYNSAQTYKQENTTYPQPGIG